MTWDYLPELDERMRIVAGYLRGRTGGKHIVDLDCREARLLRYIEPDYASYSGNDIEDVFPRGHERATFSLSTDDEFSRSVARCDILLAFGAMPPGRGREESQTLPWSFMRIVRRHGPEIVVIESVEKYFDGLRFSDPGYCPTEDLRLDLGNTWTHKRRVRIWERIAEEVGCTTRLKETA